MSKIRTTGDVTALDKAAVNVGPRIPEQASVEQPALLERAQAQGPDETLANEETVQDGAHDGGHDRIGIPDRARLRPIPRVKTVRRALGLTQEEFAARYGIPVGTLRDWEQGRTEPDQPARAYIRVIACNPEWVSQALAAEPQGGRPAVAASTGTPAPPPFPE
jgi:putative transcriptional regulator